MPPLLIATASRIALLLGALLLAPGSRAGALDEADAASAISFDTSALWYAMQDQADFLSVVATAERGHLHLEGRYNYEGRDAGSLFLGRNWSGGEDWLWSVTPMLGGVFGSTQGVAPGLELAVAYGRFDLYVEAEYVFNSAAHDESYFYSWNEIGWRVLPALRLALVGQRTRIIDNGREIQRGLQAQLVLGKFTLGIAAFNPDIAARYTIVSLAAGF